MDEGAGELSPPQRMFLAAFRETGNVRLAGKASNVGRSSHYRWLEESPDYAEAYRLACEDAIELLEAEARRRAVEGVEEPVGWYKGAPGGTVRRYSDVLLMFLLKGLLPDKYRDRTETSLKGALAHIDMSRLSDEQVQRIAAGESILSVLGAGAAAQIERLRAPLPGPPDPEALAE